MEKTLIDFGKSLEVQLTEEQLIAIKGGRRRRRVGGIVDIGDAGCPPDYED